MALSENIVQSENIPNSEFEELTAGTVLQGTLRSFRYTRDKHVIGTVVIDGRTATAYLGNDLPFSDLLNAKNQTVFISYRGIREYNGSKFPSLSVEF